ncbi:unnamed protein product, partial [Adineta ricciae]
MATTKFHTNQSIVNLLKNFTRLFQISVGYVQKSENDDTIKTCVDETEKMVNDIWTKKEGFNTIKTIYETVLTTIENTLPKKSERIQIIKKEFQSSFELAAQNIIENYRQQTKQYFLSDLYSMVINDINKYMLIERIEPLHSTRTSALQSLWKPSENMKSSTTISPKKYPKTEIIKKNREKTIQIFEKVAIEFNMSLSCLVHQLMNKKQRNNEVHKTENFMRKYHDSSQGKVEMNLSAFLTNYPRALELAEFTTEEIEKTQQAFSKYNQYINLPRNN